MNNRPFSRSHAMLLAIAIAIQQGVNMASLLAELGDYKSRGKGGKHRAKCARPQYIQNYGKYTPHQGKQEVARRFAKMQAG